MTAARRSAIDALRRRQTSIAAEPRLKLMSEEMEAAVASESVPDERLGLMFACAHPAIDASVRAPLMLQTILGFDAATIASAFLVPPATMGQRLVRAKNRIRQAGIPQDPRPRRARRTAKLRARGDLCCLCRRLDRSRRHQRQAEPFLTKGSGWDGWCFAVARRAGGAGAARADAFCRGATSHATQHSGRLCASFGSRTRQSGTPR